MCRFFSQYLSKLCPIQKSHFCARFIYFSVGFSSFKNVQKVPFWRLSPAPCSQNSGQQVCNPLPVNLRIYCKKITGVIHVILHVCHLTVGLTGKSCVFVSIWKRQTIGINFTLTIKIFKIIPQINVLCQGRN